MSAAHLAHIRFGYGPRLGDSDIADPQDWLRAQLTVQAPVEPAAPVSQGIRARFDDSVERARNNGMLEGPGRVAAVVRADSLAWARQRLLSAQPFRDRLVDLWANHLTVSRRSGPTAELAGAYEAEAIRPHVTGRFADMLVAAVLHPAMLLYLNAAASIGPNSEAGQRSGRGLNENLAREVLELHTLTPAGGYTQGDVTEFAKILTGWTVVQRAEPFTVQFRPNAHEPGEKTLLGRRFPPGEHAAEAALRFLADRPATHRHLALRLARHFLADDPAPADIRAIEGALRDTGGDLGAAAGVVIGLRAAWDPPLTKFRRPVDHVLAATRAIGLPAARADQVLGGLFALGQGLWNAPQPDGWSDLRAAWQSPDTLMRRVDWSYTLAGRAGRIEAAEVAAAALGPLATAETVAAMRAAGSQRDAVTILFGSPEFLHR